MEFHDIIGTVGVGFIVVMYTLLQTGRMSSENPHFSIWNAVGAALILVSLAYEFNLSAMLMEGFWLLISLYGLVRTKRAV